MTEPNEFQRIVCVLTNEDCTDTNCSECETASEEEKEAEKRDRESLIPDEHKRKFDIEYFRNKYNTVAKFEKDTPKEDIIKVLDIKGFSSETIPYDVEKLLTRWPHFAKVKNILSLGIPDRLEKVDHLLFAYYDDGYTYVAAHMWTDEEFNNRHGN